MHKKICNIFLRKIPLSTPLHPLQKLHEKSDQLRKDNMWPGQNSYLHNFPDPGNKKSCRGNRTAAPPSCAPPPGKGAPLGVERPAFGFSKGKLIYCEAPWSCQVMSKIAPEMIEMIEIMATSSSLFRFQIIYNIHLGMPWNCEFFWTIFWRSPALPIFMGFCHCHGILSRTRSRRPNHTPEMYVR